MKYTTYDYFFLIFFLFFEDLIVFLAFLDSSFLEDNPGGFLTIECALIISSASFIEIVFFVCFDFFFIELIIFSSYIDPLKIVAAVGFF